MSKLKLSGGASSKNSVAFFLKKNNKGVEAVRQDDGTIVTKDVDSAKQWEMLIKLLNAILFLSTGREVVCVFSLPLWLYHVPTFIWSAIFLIAVLIVALNPEMRMYHGAEHKVAHWYSKKNRGEDIESIKKCSRIHGYCGTNLLATFVTFQIISSICLGIFNVHIPEIITISIPIFVYNIFPFNFIGIFSQLFTTAPPTEKHIEVALQALSTLIKNESE